MRAAVAVAVAVNLAGALAIASPLPAQARREVRDSTIAPGVRWRHIVDPAGPWVIDLVTVDRRRCNCAFRAVRAKDSLVARERVSAMVARQGDAGRVVAAINADFFDVKTGENENNQVIDGEWWKGVRVTDSPYDAFDNAHAQFAIDAAGRPRMQRYLFDGTVVHGGAAFPLTSLNFIPRGTLEATVLYTARYGVTPRDSARRMAEVALRKVRQRGDTSVYVLASAPAQSGGNAIPATEAVLAAYGPRSGTVAKFAQGDTIRIVLGAYAQLSTLRLPQLLVGGWPRILRNGMNIAVRAPWDEGTISSNAEARHPRSAIGFSRDSARIYLMTVDGRSQKSAGMTLVEMAGFLRGQGVWDALNFDGGGSSTLVVRGRVVNAPADREGERPVGNAILVVVRP